VAALTGVGIVATRDRGRSSSSTNAVAPSVTPSVLPSTRLTAPAPRWTLTGHTAMVTAVAWSRGGRLLASGSADRTVRIWDCSQNPPTLLHVLTGHEAPVTRLSFGAGTMLASVADWDARIWDAGTGTPLRQLPRFGSFSGWQGDAVFSRTGSHLLRQSQTADVVMHWAVPSWKPTPLTFPGINAVTRSGGAVFTVDSGEVIGIDADSGLSKAHLSLDGTLYGADTAWAPSAQQFATAGSNGKVKIWAAT
jgi:WD40 repeat protein